jgi:hypothetical protein
MSFRERFEGIPMTCSAKIEKLRQKKVKMPKDRIQ